MTYHDPRNALARDMIPLIDADVRGEIHLPRTVAERVLEEAALVSLATLARYARDYRDGQSTHTSARFGMALTYAEALLSGTPRDEAWAVMEYEWREMGGCGTVEYIDLTAYRDSMKNEHAASDCPACHGAGGGGGFDRDGSYSADAYVEYPCQTCGKEAAEGATWSDGANAYISTDGIAIRNDQDAD